MPLKEMKRRIDARFIALKTDITITEADPIRREELISGLKAQQKVMIEQLEEDFAELKLLRDEARDWATALGVKPNEALQLLVLRETRHIHFHEDEQAETKEK